MKNIWVTGAAGQLGSCIREKSSEFPDYNFFFSSKADIDIENAEVVSNFLKQKNIGYCINAAAYTNVEKAESEEDIAFRINAEAVKNLALACKENNVVLFHISTDYVFDGKKTTPYTEEDQTNPLNVYGASKLKGEEHIQEICKQYFIFRTSWLYSQYGHNFLKTIINYVAAEKSLTITTEQVGTPTNANDLADAILHTIDSKNFGLYNYSNEGETTWHGFAEAIIEFTGQKNIAKLEKTDYYRTFAARPNYSVLDLSKSRKVLGVKVLPWKESLKSLLINKMGYE